MNSTKLIGQLHWALFIVIQSLFCFGLFVYLFIAELDSNNKPISAQMQTSAQFKFALYSKHTLIRNSHGTEKCVRNSECSNYRMDFKSK